VHISSFWIPALFLLTSLTFAQLNDPEVVLSVWGSSGAILIVSVDFSVEARREYRPQGKKSRFPNENQLLADK